MPAMLAAPIPAGWCVHAAFSTCFLIAACKLCCQVAQLTCFNQFATKSPWNAIRLRAMPTMLQR